MTGSLPHEAASVQHPASAEEIDEIAYVAANPDVAGSGLSPPEHFRRIGQGEGRIQYANVAIIDQMRQEKLRQVTWRPRRSPLSMTSRGALNFIPPDIASQFGIPEDVPVSAHPYSTRFAELVRNNRDKLFLDLGAGLRHVYYDNVVNADIYPSASTDVICVGEDLPFADELFDFIFCFAVQEHTLRPWDVVREMCRVLKVGGTVFVDWPFLQGMHGYPHHYFNATPRGNESLLEPYCEVAPATIERHHHPAIAANWI